MRYKNSINNLNDDKEMKLNMYKVENNIQD